jgi:hypothetical protein
MRECTSDDTRLSLLAYENEPISNVEKCKKACAKTPGCNTFLTHWKYDKCYWEQSEDPKCRTGNRLKKASNYDIYELITTYE